MITGCFLAYGIGTIAINVLTLWYNNPVFLSVFSAILAICCTLPSLYCFLESPKYLMRKGEFSKMVEVLSKMAEANRTEYYVNEETILSRFLEDRDLVESLKGYNIKVQVEQTEKPVDSPFQELFFKTKYQLYPIIS